MQDPLRGRRTGLRGNLQPAPWALLHIWVIRLRALAVVPVRRLALKTLLQIHRRRGLENGRLSVDRVRVWIRVPERRSYADTEEEAWAKEAVVEKRAVREAVVPNERPVVKAPVEAPAVKAAAMKPSATKASGPAGHGVARDTGPGQHTDTTSKPTTTRSHQCLFIIFPSSTSIGS